MMQRYFVRKSFGVGLPLFVLIVFAMTASAQNMFRKITDFDGDGRADYAVTRIENGLRVWYVWQSSAGFKVFQWGINFDRNAAGDYDGDGKTDFAVYREASGFPALYTFYIFNSQSGTFTTRVFSSGTFLGNFPMHQDYDGDGKTDPAFWLTEGTGGLVNYFRSSLNSMSSFMVPFNDFAARIGDLDGDGRADRTSYRPSNNLVTITNIATNNTRMVLFGTTNDTYVPADFDGDGIGDLTVWRGSEGNWYWLKSSDGAFQSAHWGTSGDIPAPGDYDGDGKTDLAVYRRASPQSHYWVNGSSNGVSVFAWGLATDSPVLY